MPDTEDPPETLSEVLAQGITIEPAKLREGVIIVVYGFDDIPEHTFEITDVWDDCVSGYSLDGPLKGTYGEPEFALIKAILRR